MIDRLERLVDEARAQADAADPCGALLGLLARMLDEALRRPAYEALTPAWQRGTLLT